MTHNSVTVPWLCLKKHFSTAVNKECYPVISAILALPVGHVFVNSQRTSSHDCSVEMIVALARVIM